MPLCYNGNKHKKHKKRKYFGKRGERMVYQEAMELLSQCGLGAVLLGADGRILFVNESGDQMLHGDGELVGKPLEGIAVELCQETDLPLYVNIAFGEYLVRCPTPTLPEIPEETQLIVFRDARYDAGYDLLLSTVNQLSERIAMYDQEGRLYQLNDSAVRMESVIAEEVLGRDVLDVYSINDENDLTAPEVLRSRRAILNRHQHYINCYGNAMDVMVNTYPIVQNGQLLGAVCIMEDWTAASKLQKQVVDLQEQIMRLSSQPHRKSQKLLPAQYEFKDIIYRSAVMEDAIRKCKRVAKTDASVMLYGETGTGKELFAQSIHNASDRANGPFLAINCAAIPENLLESTLFGTEKGAYTGAERRMGLLEQADSGTLLLDELNSMDMALQAKLLRVLQEGVLRRVGGSALIRIDVRVLSNINVPPRQAIEEHKLRQDLFYRLGVVNINIPPLRERKEDIRLLAKSFIMQNNKKLARNIQNIDGDTLEILQMYDWPGNVRELQHAIEQAMIVLPDDYSVITPEYIPEHILQRIATPDHVEEAMTSEAAASAARRTRGRSLNGYMKNVERETLCQALRENEYNISRTARQLNMSRQNLQYRLRRHQIDVKQLMADDAGK